MRPIKPSGHVLKDYDLMEHKLKECGLELERE